jgi:hypothetical protein
MDTRHGWDLDKIENAQEFQGAMQTRREQQAEKLRDIEAGVLTAKGEAKVWEDDRNFNESVMKSKWAQKNKNVMAWAQAGFAAATEKWRAAQARVGEAKGADPAPSATTTDAPWEKDPDYLKLTPEQKAAFLARIKAK